jgi:hypothetical protein
VFYWREEYFQDLKAAADAANASAKWTDYGTFCLEYERGLRHQAFAVLGRFIHSMELEPFAERRQFVSWLMSIAHGRKAGHMLIPHPLKIRVVEPTLLEWTVVEPTCSEPHRWLGGYEHLEKAIELDPADQIALREFVVCLLSQVNYATHELPVGYLGSALKDMDTLNRAEVLLPRISSDNDRTAYAADVAEQKALIHEYLRKHP